VTWLTDNDHRSAMLITGLFFVFGFVVLQSVDPERGRRAAAAPA
jgi:UMF1 family MFS transporter